MERETRFELATFALARRRSTTEPLPQVVRMAGLEPTHRRYQILSLARLPFRHIRTVWRKFGAPFLVIHPRIELGTPWLKVMCSTDWANGPYMAGVAGFEPTRCQSQSLVPYRLATPQSIVGWVMGVEPMTSRATTWRSNQLSYTHQTVLASLKGFEPPTHGLEGRCSIQLSYRLTSGAGDGNRTHAISLEGWDSTIELHPRVKPLYLQRLNIIP